MEQSDRSNINALMIYFKNICYHIVTYSFSQLHSL